MARYCYINYNDEGILVCLVQHRKPKLCDMYEEVCEHGYPIDECKEEEYGTTTTNREA